MRRLQTPTFAPSARRASPLAGTARSWLAAAGLLGVAVLLSGCASDVSSGRRWYEPYRIEVVQGNVVTREMADALRPGFTRDQVRAVLGTPLLADIFHANRWDYVFSIRRQGAEPQSRRVTVFFEGDRMARFEAGELPSEREFVAAIDVRKPPSSTPKLSLSDAELQAIALPVVKAAPAADAASGPARTYPPLEPAKP